jgi:hypothetical protein
MFSVRQTMETIDSVKYVMDALGNVMAMYRQMAISRNGIFCMLAKERTLGIFAGNQWELKPGLTRFSW